VAETIDGDSSFIQIEDWSDLRDASLETRKYYII